MKNMKNNNGITMVALVVTIIILLMLAGISVGTGERMIKKSKLENIKTNMLLIEVKGKEYLEKASFNLGAFDKINLGSEEAKQQEIQERIETAKSELVGEEITSATEFLTQIGVTAEILSEENSNNIYYYKLSTQDLIDMGIQRVKSDEDDGWFIVRYDLKNITINVYNTKGFEVENNVYYELNEIQNVNV